MRKKIIISEDLQELIKQDILISQSMKKTANKFNISEYFVKKITQWNIENYNEYLIKTFGTKQERMKKKIEKNKIYLKQPQARDKKNKRQNKWKRLHPIKRMVWNATIAAKKYKDENILTFQEVWGKAREQKLICPFSGEKLTTDTISLDHIIPLSRGGKNVIENVELIHFRINIMKSNLLAEEFNHIIQTVYNYTNCRTLSPRDSTSANEPKPLTTVPVNKR